MNCPSGEAPTQAKSHKHKTSWASIRTLNKIRTLTSQVSSYKEVESSHVKNKNKQSSNTE